jgi:hypothetical protein
MTIDVRFVGTDWERLEAAWPARWTGELGRPGDGSAPSEEWLPLLKRIRDGGKLGGTGFALHIEDRMTAQEAGDFLHLLAREGRYTL